VQVLVLHVLELRPCLAFLAAVLAEPGDRDQVSVAPQALVEAWVAVRVEPPDLAAAADWDAERPAQDRGSNYHVEDRLGADQALAADPAIDCRGLILQLLADRHWEQPSADHAYCQAGSDSADGLHPGRLAAETLHVASGR